MTKLAKLFITIVGLTTAASSAPGLVWKADDYVLVPERLFYGAGFSMMIAAKQQFSRHPSYLNVLINSDGGSLDGTTENFVLMLRELRTHNVTVNCVVTKRAISMAVIILAECSNRYALPTSIIMWHGIRREYPRSMNQFELQGELTELQALDDKMWNPWRALINNDQYYQFNFKTERLVPALELINKAPGAIQLTTLEIVQ